MQIGLIYFFSMFRADIETTNKYCLTLFFLKDSQTSISFYCVHFGNLLQIIAHVQSLKLKSEICI